MSTIGLKTSGTFFLSLHKINIMKIKLLVSILKDGKRFSEGDELNIADHKGEIWISKNWAQSIDKKESKIKKETKELKLDSKETKNETI